MGTVQAHRGAAAGLSEQRARGGAPTAAARLALGQGARGLRGQRGDGLLVQVRCGHPCSPRAHLPAAYLPSLVPRSESVFLEIEGKVRLTPNDTDWMERPEAFACSALGSTTGDQQSKVTISRDLPAVLVPLATISLGTALV